MRFIFSILTFCIILACLLLITSNIVLADTQAGGKSETKSGGTVSLNNPLGDTTDVRVILGRVIDAALGIVGSIALLMFIYGGFMWLTSAGRAEMVNKGRDAMIWAGIGLGVIFGAYALVHFVIFEAILGN